MTQPHLQHLVLAVYPFARGFAYVLFEGPDAPFDWGVKEIRVREKNAKTIEELKKIIDRYRPEVLVVEDTGGKAPRRSERIRKLYRLLSHLAAAEYLDFHRFSRGEVRKLFAHVGAATKYEIAKVIATQLPAFAHLLPRVRKPWMNADPRQSLFDAAALGFAYFARGMLGYDDASA